MTHHAKRHPLEIAFRVMERDQAENLGLEYALNFRNAVLGLAHEHGDAVLYLARCNPNAPGEDWPETWYQVGAGHPGVSTLRTLLRTRLAMPPHVAYAVAFLFGPYILCLAPTRRDLPKLLAHEDALVRSTTQLHLGGSNEGTRRHRPRVPRSGAG